MYRSNLTPMLKKTKTFMCLDIKNINDNFNFQE